MPAARRTLPKVHEIEAVIFDLDGVLVDSEPVHFRAANRVLGRYGAAITEAKYRCFIGLGEIATWREWRRSYALPDDLEVLLAAHTAARLEEIAAGVPRIEAAVTLAHDLHRARMRLAIASSSTLSVIDALLTRLGLEAIFDVRVSGEDPEVRHSKPAPDVYLVAAARLALSPTACLAIEDSEPGVTAAARAGMTCIAVPNPWTAHQDFGAADVVLESLRYFPLLVL